ncbi:MAG: DUF2062 domain-containing protein [Nitrospirota bacterium]
MKFNPKEKLYELLSLNDSSRHIALSFAIGVFISVSPFLGFHTIAALLIAWIFRLNKVAIMVGTYTNNPWTFAPVYGFGLWIGLKLYGIKETMPDISWGNTKIMDIFNYLKPYFMPFIIGSLLLGFVAAAISYFAVDYAVQRFRKRRGVETTP